MLTATVCVTEFSGHFRGVFFFFFAVSVDLQRPGIWLSICEVIAAAGFMQTSAVPLTHDGNGEYSLLQNMHLIDFFSARFFFHCPLIPLIACVHARNPEVTKTVHSCCFRFLGRYAFRI